METARDFNLLGESVPLVRVSARALALRGFFIEFILAPFFYSLGYHHPLTPWIRCLNQSDWLLFGEQKGARICTMDLVCQMYVERSSVIFIYVCVLSETAKLQHAHKRPVERRETILNLTPSAWEIKLLAHFLPWPKCPPGSNSIRLLKSILSDKLLQAVLGDPCFYNRADFS